MLRGNTVQTKSLEMPAKMSSPLSNCSCYKPRCLTFAVKTWEVGRNEAWGMWRWQGSNEQGQEFGLMLGDVELCSSKLTAKDGCFPHLILWLQFGHTLFWRSAPSLSVL